jgi:hypothetical protein
MKVEIVNVTPRLAAEWLATSAGNPRWKKGQSSKGKLYDERIVARIAEDMRNGNWNPGTNTIGFGVDGKLKEGHHRLAAVVKAGVTVPMVVVWGITTDGELHIDDNRTRQESVRTGISRTVLGVPSVHLACVRGMATVDRYALSLENKLRFIDLHPCIFEVERICHSGGKRNSYLNFAIAVHALMCAYEFGVSTTKLESFAKAIQTGFVDDGSQSSAITIRNTLIQTKGDQKTRVRLSLDFAIQAALFDYCNGIPRRRPYNAKTGRYFDMNIAHGNRLYLSMYGREWCTNENEG